MLAALTLSSAFSIFRDNPVLISGNILGYTIAITQSQIIYWIIAALVGIVAESIVGWRLPFGIIGAIIASLIGVWLLTDVISLNIGGNITIGDQTIPVLKAFLGAIIVVTIWHLLTYRSWRGRHRYYRGRREGYRRREREYRSEGYRRRRRREY